MMQHIIPPSGSRHLSLSRRLSPRRICRHRFMMPPPAANGGGGYLSERSFSTRWYPWSANRSMPPPSTYNYRGLTPSMSRAVECRMVIVLNLECISLLVHRLFLDPEQTRPVPALCQQRHGKRIAENA